MTLAAVQLHGPQLRHDVAGDEVGDRATISIWTIALCGREAVEHRFVCLELHEPNPLRKLVGITCYGQQHLGEHISALCG